jgi:two-component system invasion response regulator UvrY
MTRVLVADDHPMVRRGLVQILREAGGLEVAGEAGDYAGVMRALRETEADVLVLDHDLPGRSGLEILRVARREFPRVAVLLFSMHPESLYGVRAIRAGAAGYVPKSASPATLVEAIRAAAEGRRFVTPELALALAERVADDGDRLPHELLSDRELQTLKLIASGQRLSEIAAALSLSPKTVSVYRSRLLEKMRMRTNAELTHYAVKNGLVA